MAEEEEEGGNGKVMSNGENSSGRAKSVQYTMRKYIIWRRSEG